MAEHKILIQGTKSTGVAEVGEGFLRDTGGYERKMTNWQDVSGERFLISQC